MASFLTDLWTSIFTPGPTPTLLVATNATFAALQSLLLVLLISTYSIHFLVLSFLSGGLWWAINWFAAELRAANQKEEEAQRLRDLRRQRSGGNNGADNGEADDETENDTEVEAAAKKDTVAAKSGSREDTPLPASTVAAPSSEGADEPVRVDPGSVSSSGFLSASLDEANLNALRKRFSIGDRSGGEFSTDSEWEKVEATTNGVP
ncbi:putative ER membrane protein [Xylona heveae TC161]|uniref:Putative ER membrane protein n=1 Tax=Xylona heveae (strain CBS 132557 / TC161) TaxID=1328760 RepID=A0A165I3Y6_XYLHT|nr:putative ER membrane protein [Xylona heveae TC161]KZF24348.1 putative ER membrane protein [Xylona heveae TC161]